MRFDQSSPVQPVSESRGGTLSVTNERAKDKQTKEILVSNFGCSALYFTALNYAAGYELYYCCAVPCICVDISDSILYICVKCSGQTWTTLVV